MRAVVQRVSTASVTINAEVKSAIGQGFMILLGIEAADTKDDADWLSKKIAQLRVFSDEEGLMNKDIKEVNGEVLVVSQFTLHASYKKGNRPSFIRAARPEQAIPLYEYFTAQMTELLGKPTATGTFGADMKVALVNDGPVTIIMDTQNRDF
jgi:D-tyrosyl-tRNA(Tyr) deacylase